jgi:hypothetical protein
MIAGMRAAFWVAGCVLLCACSGETSGANAACAPTGECVDPTRRYEPAERIDFDNVVAPGGMATILDLPEPPKSGFRLIVPPRQLEPGAEVSTCVAWPYPQIRHKHVYAARIYSTGGLHHSNMYGISLHPTLGPSPYPRCNPGQTDIVGRVGELLAGNIPDVLFANSTQIVEGEGIVFAPGMAFALHTDGREIATSIHFLNTNPEPTTVEVVYDFFTMPEDEVTTELVPYYFDNYAFQVPPDTEQDVATTCSIYGGNLVSLMPHTHRRTKAFVVDLLQDDAAEQRIYEGVGFDLESDIRVFSEPIDLSGYSQIRHTCTIDNDLGVPIEYGIGDNEMCTLFGYLFPPEAQPIGITLTGESCTSLHLGASR